MSPDVPRETFKPSQWVPHEVSECVICKAPLGQETKDLAIPVCHEHANCPVCNFRIETSAEIDYCWRNNIFPAQHARCLAVTQKINLKEITKDFDLTVELLNIARLLIFPNPALSRDGRSSEMQTGLTPLIHLRTHDQLLMIAEQARTIASTLSLAAARKKHEVELEEETPKEREKRERHAEAMRAAERERLKPKTKTEEKVVEKKKSNDEKSFGIFLGMAEQMIAVGKLPADTDIKVWALEQLNALKSTRKDMLS